MLSKIPSVINNPSAINADCRCGDKMGVLIIMLMCGFLDITMFA